MYPPHHVFIILYKKVALFDRKSKKKKKYPKQIKKLLTGSTFSLCSVILFLLPQVNFLTLFIFFFALDIAFKDCIVMGFLTSLHSLYAFYSHDIVPPWRGLASPLVTYPPLLWVGTLTELATVMRLLMLPHDLFRNLSLLCCQNFISESLHIVLRCSCFYEAPA